MKKTTLFLALSVGCFTAMAQMPATSDTTNRFNNAPAPNQMNMSPQAAPAADTVLSVTPVPVPDVNNSQRIDSVANGNATVPATNTTDDMNSAVTVDSAAKATSTDPVVTPATDNMPAASATVTTDGTMANAPLPRGVNVSHVVVTGLNRYSALPILNTWVPAATVDQLKNQYGEKLYDITLLKVAENQYAYSARIQEDGVYKAVIVNDSGAAGM